MKEGDLVEIGQRVAQMGFWQLTAQKLRAQADIASAQSQVAAAHAQVLVTKSQRELAEKELRPTEELIATGGTTRQLYDIEVSERDVACASVADAEANILLTQRNVDAAKVVAEEISISIADAELSSAVFGRVLYRLAEPGEVLATMAGFGGVFLIVSLMIFRRSITFSKLFQSRLKIPILYQLILINTTVT